MTHDRIPATPPTYDAPEWLDYLVETAIDDRGPVVWMPTQSVRTSALQRIPRFPADIDPLETDTLRLDVLPNGRRSIQLAVADTQALTDLRLEPATLTSATGESLPPSAISVQFVGYVPVERSFAAFQGHSRIEDLGDAGISGDRHPDVIADPLFDLPAISVPAYRAQPLWVTIQPPASTPPGEYSGTIDLVADGWQRSLDLTVTVRESSISLPDEKNFHLNLWLNPDAIATEHGEKLWSSAHWSLLETYFTALAAAGQDAVTAPIVHEPWIGQWLGGTWRSQTASGYTTTIEWHESAEGWSFDYETFDRLVRTARSCGVGPEIHAHSLLSFRSPQRLTYVEDESGDQIVERLEVGDDRWWTAWTAFLGDFVDHLDEHGWIEDTYLAFDERPPELMETAIDLIKEAAPRMADNIHIAGSEDVEPYADDLSLIYNDLPLKKSTLDQRRADGKRTSFYVCVHPAHPNTFTASPLQETRQLPWIAAEHELAGLLRWAFCSWPERPYQNPVHKFVQGDEYLIYPGPEGPRSSLRWEQLREGIEDFELIKLAAQAGVPDETIEFALDLATSTVDGRSADPRSLIQARRLLLDALEPR